jgi:hypothetical protein
MGLRLNFKSGRDHQAKLIREERSIGGVYTLFRIVAGRGGLLRALRVQEFPQFLFGLEKRTPRCGRPADLPHPRADRRARRCSALPASFLRLICEPHPVAEKRCWTKTAAASYARVEIQSPDRDRVPMPS